MQMHENGQNTKIFFKYKIFVKTKKKFFCRLYYARTKVFVIGDRPVF